MRTTSLLLLPMLLALLGACATARVDDPALEVTLVVTGLRQDERELLRAQVCSIEDVRDCQLLADPAPPQPRRKKRRGDEPPPPPSSPEAKIAFRYRGSLGELRAKIAALPHPGLEATRADVQLGFRGFDNLAPHIKVDAPAEGDVFAKSSVEVAVVVADPDTAEVEIGGDEAPRGQDGSYRRTVEDLKEGDNEVVVIAIDQAGNRREQKVKVVVDTTPPTLEVEVAILAYDKAVVKGRVRDFKSVTVDGREVEVGVFGSFEKEIAVDPDRTMVDVVAVDALGNQKKIRRSVKIASPMSGDTK